MSTDCTMIDDDWDSVVDAYNLDSETQDKSYQKQLTSINQWDNENACLRIIRQKHEKKKELIDDLNKPESQQKQEFGLQIHLVYNQSMQADIITDSDNFNQYLMTRYTMCYDHIPQSLFVKFQKQECLDHSKCERVKLLKLENSNEEGYYCSEDKQSATKKSVLEIEINVKNQNEGADGLKKSSKNMNEIFKFTCQRYHSYINQIIESFKNKEVQFQSQGGAQQINQQKDKQKNQFKNAIDDDFEFMASTKGLGSKIKGMRKITSSNVSANQQQAKKEISNVNQLDQIFLCEIFKLNRSKQSLIQELSKNVDSSNVFEFLRLAANDSSNKETQHEAYWMIVYIFLKRVCGIDIVSSFQSQKCKKMLSGINLMEYSFADGHLVYKNMSSQETKKVDLKLLIKASQEIQADKLQQFMLTNNMHNLTKVLRSRSEQGVFSDYPHFYRLVQEGKELSTDNENEPKVLEDGTVKQPYHGDLFAQRWTENGEFIISCRKDDFTLYGQNFVGLLKPNFLGTSFELYNSGFEETIAKQLTEKFLPIRQKVALIEYDSNFFAEKPRSFRVSFYDFIRNDSNTITHKFENMQPRYNEARGCYTLNFYGRVQKASARNFQLVQSNMEGEEEVEDDMGDLEMPLLTHGKISKNEFNLDYRAPFQILCSFAVSLSAIGKKRVVG